VESFVLHEDHVTDFHAINKILHTRSHVTASGPDVFGETNFLGGDFKTLGQPVVIKLNAFFFKKVILIGVIKNLNSNHDEPRVMPAGQPDVVQIIEPYTELRSY
jgi:hypothetical protein